MPVIRTKKAMDQGAKEVLVLGTTQVAKENVLKLASSQGYQAEMVSDGKDNWEMKLTRK